MVRKELVEAASEKGLESVQPPTDIMVFRLGLFCFKALSSAKLPASPACDCCQVYFPPNVCCISAQGSVSATSPFSIFVKA